MTSYSKSGPPFAASHTARTMEPIGSWYEFESDVATSGARTEESDIKTPSLSTVELWDLFPMRLMQLSGANQCGGLGLFPHGYESDRKSTRLNSSHSQISYAVFCLKKKKKKKKKNVDFNRYKKK